MRKPRLTSRVIDGLKSVHSMARANQFIKSYLYAGCKDYKEEAIVDDSISWLDNLIHWYEEEHKCDA